MNTATQKDKLFRDKSSSFYTSTPVSIEETCINKKKSKRPFNGCKNSCDEHEPCDHDDSHECSCNTKLAAKECDKNSQKP